MPPVLANRLLSSLSNKLKLFCSHSETPFMFLASIVQAIHLHGSALLLATSTAKPCYNQPIFTPDLGRWDGNQDVILTGSQNINSSSLRLKNFLILRPVRITYASYQAASLGNKQENKDAVMAFYFNSQIQNVRNLNIQITYLKIQSHFTKG